MELKEIINLHEQIDEILTKFKNDKEFGFDKDIDRFCLLAKLLNPQTYGNRVQCYFANIMDYTIIPSSLDKGDFLNKYGETVEFKCSFLTKLSRDINVRQIRTYQSELKYYYVFTVDFLDYNNIRYKTYRLTKSQMLQEVNLLGAKPCHSTKVANTNNLNVEVGFAIKYGSLNHKRWESTYLLNEFDIKSISIKKIESMSEVEKLKNTIEQLQLLLDSKK